MRAKGGVRRIGVGGSLEREEYGKERRYVDKNPNYPLPKMPLEKKGGGPGKGLEKPIFQKTSGRGVQDLSLRIQCLKWEI